MYWLAIYLLMYMHLMVCDMLPFLSSRKIALQEAGGFNQCWQLWPETLSFPQLISLILHSPLGLSFFSSFFYFSLFSVSSSHFFFDLSLFSVYLFSFLPLSLFQVFFFPFFLLPSTSPSLFSLLPSFSSFLLIHSHLNKCQQIWPQEIPIAWGESYRKLGCGITGMINDVCRKFEARK